MKKKLIILLLLVFALPIGVNAAGGFGVSSTSITMYQGESKTVNITTSNSVGRLNISSSNTGVATVSTGSVFIQNPGSSSSITIKGKSVGTATISVVASDNFATMDEEILAGQKRTIKVTVKAKTNNGGNTTNNQTNNKSTNNKLKDITIDGYDLKKVNDNNYTLTVPKDVSSVNVKATAVDTKAKVTGTGNHDLKVGDNNIEVIITSESGAQNKIIVKVTRKDAFYLEDLDTVLKDSKSNDIVVNADTKLSSNDLKKIKESGKKINLIYTDNNKKELYIWTIDGSKIDNNTEFNTGIVFNSDNKKDILKISNYADGLFYSMKEKDNYPQGTKVKLYVGDKYQNDDIVNVYYYNSTSNKLELIKEKLSITDGYIEIDTEKGTDYFVTMSNVSLQTKDKSNTTVEKTNNNILTYCLIGSNVLLLFIIIILLGKTRSKKKK